MSRDQVRRLAALEAKLAPVVEPEVIWDPWQEILSADEDALLWRLTANKERFALGLSATLGDHAVLLDDDADLALLTAILAKAEAPFPPRWAFLSRQGHGVDVYFDCLGL